MNLFDVIVVCLTAGVVIGVFIGVYIGYAMGHRDGANRVGKWAQDVINQLEGNA